MATQLQLRKGSTAQTAIFTGAVAEVTVDTTQKTVVVHDGTTAGGNYIVTKGQLESNVSILQGVNTTQNTNITAVNGYAAGAFTTANGANGLASGAYAAANTNAADIVIIQGVNTTQNTNITAVNGYAAAAYGQANTNATNITAVNGYATSAYATANGANGLAAGAYNHANTAYSYATTIDSYAQSAFSTANGANGLAAAAYNKANTGGTFSGTVTVSQDLYVSGNVFITGNVVSSGANELIVNDPIIYVANNNTANTVDIGLVGNFTGGSPSAYQHTGIVRDSSDGTWKFFSNVAAEPTTTVDFTYAVYDNLKVGALTGNVIANSITTDSITTSTGVTVGTSSTVGISSNTFTTSSTTQVAVDTFSASVYRSAKYQVQITSGIEYHAIELLVLHDGTTTYLTQYAEVLTGASLGTFDTDISGGNVRLLFTGANSVSTVNIFKTTLIV